ncbi:MAG: CBS domain-containing protein [Pseudohongiellaceae bacterium]|nr:CBS domain-containing protein [Pseudohongiellaceae bacterium]
MILSKIMSKPVATVSMDTDLATIKEIFDNAAFHHLLVESRGVLYGVISDRDLLQALSPFIDSDFETRRDHATLNKRAHQIMTRQPITLEEHHDVFDAIAVFEEHSVSCIPIVDHERRILGIVSWRDIISLLHKNRDKLRKR